MDQKIDRLNSRRLVDDVYTRLRESILSGELAPGTRLRVAALADRFGTSRSPIREAVQRLARERLAHEEPRKGVAVAAISKEALVSLYELREVLEGLAARLATERRTPELIAALEQTLERHRLAYENDDVHGFREADTQFHRQLVDAASNSELSRSLDDVLSKIRIAMFTRVSGGRQKALEDHEAILAAVKAGPPEDSERAARAHIARLRATLRSLLPFESGHS